MAFKLCKRISSFVFLFELHLKLHSIFDRNSFPSWLLFSCYRLSTTRCTCAGLRTYSTKIVCENLLSIVRSSSSSYLNNFFLTWNLIKFVFSFCETLCQGLKKLQSFMTTECHCMLQTSIEWPWWRNEGAMRCFRGNRGLALWLQ